jgi:P pilus assembly chaperone PapD
LAIRLSYSTQRAAAHYMEGAIMALRRQKNNIVNLALVIANEDEKAGMTIDQTILNGKSAAVSFRLVNGGRKSAAVKLDRQACADLLEAVTEILASEGDF